MNNKYRIIKDIHGQFYVERKYLGLFWWPITEGGYAEFFDAKRLFVTVERAEEFINKLKRLSQLSPTVIKEL